MNKKGFTLIELIIVVSIMAILGIFVTISFTSSLRDANQKNCNEFVKKAEDAACVAVATYKKGDNSVFDVGFNDSCITNGCNLTLSWLYDTGYFNETKDACTDSDVNFSEIVTVSYNGGQKICEYQGQSEYGR